MDEREKKMERDQQAQCINLPSAEPEVTRCYYNGSSTIYLRRKNSTNSYRELYVSRLGRDDGRIVITDYSYHTCKATDLYGAGSNWAVVDRYDGKKQVNTYQLMRELAVGSREGSVAQWLYGVRMYVIYRRWFSGVFGIVMERTRARRVHAAEIHRENRRRSDRCIKEVQLGVENICRNIWRKNIEVYGEAP